MMPTELRHKCYEIEDLLQLELPDSLAKDLLYVLANFGKWAVEVEEKLNTQHLEIRILKQIIEEQTK